MAPELLDQGLPLVSKPYGYSVAERLVIILNFLWIFVQRAFACVFGTSIANMPLQVQRRRRVPARQISRLLSAVENLVELQAKAVQDSTSLKQNLVVLKDYKESQLSLDSKYLQRQDGNRTRRQIRQQWRNEILQCVPIFGETATDSLEEVITNNPLWSRKEFGWAYPQSFVFLGAVSVTTIQAILSSCTVRYYNPYLPIGRGRFGGMELLEFATSEKNRVPVPEQLWEIMQRAPVGLHRSRTLCITDLSPAIAAILIASTPRCAA